ncbi:valine--tRNA ligase [Amaricoccus macauensis]|uniref:valine--tRNA ligase n=1 Tax=Amaricoccus macauensis TaxID=57001 RepID=UPI003C7E88E1
MPMEKTFDAASAEPRISAKWDDAKAFVSGANAKPGPNGEPAEPFCILLPPPNVTGSLHMGHAFNHTLMDILTRWHRMQGDDVLWQPGLDHAGIATQMVVERQLAAAGAESRRDMGREKFVAKVWDWKAQSGGTILEQCKRLGDSFDLSRNAFTMSGAPGAPAGEEGNFHDAVLKAFVTFYERGLIYRGKRLVNWDPKFETAISDLEVENIEVDGHMWHFKYPLAGGETYEYVEKDEDGNVTLRETRDYISIATTRPETMLGDGAVAVHPSDERYAPIIGKLCEIPVGPKEHRRLIPIITDEYPDPDFGSGAVKITGAHDFNDYQVAKRGGIPMYRLMDTQGRMRDDGAPYAEAAARAQELAGGAAFTENEVDALNLVPDDLRGLDRFEARKRVVEQISDEGLAVMTVATDPRLGKAAVKKPVAPEEGGEARDEDLVPLVEAKKIMQPFGDRSKVVIEPMLTDQWFVDAEKLAGPALKAVHSGKTRILPEQYSKVYDHWLENIEPWCISRQLWWGHQIPVWYDDDGNHYCAMSEAEAVEKAGGKSLTRDPDVLDTWFSSGIWPIGTMGWPEETADLAKFHPSSVLVTGFDILFFWVARMMMMQLELVGDVPFKDVYIHALVRDEKGKKMSKSLGNVLDPIELIDEYGADAVRFTLSSMAALGRDVKLSKDRIAGYRNFGTKLWNATRFAEMNGCVAKPGFDPKAVTLPANNWIVGETGKVREQLDAALTAYRFNDASAALYAFVWGKVCDWYVELAKPLFDDPEAAEETRATMAWVIDQCLILMHPFMPFVTEELWDVTGERATLLAHADWPGYGAELVDAKADDEMNWVIGLIEEIRSVRAQMHVPAGAKVTLIALDLNQERKALLSDSEALVAKLARVERFETAEAAPKGAVTLAVGGATFCLPLADVIDVSEERKRLGKALGKLEKEVKGLRSKLSNEAFLAKAPEAVVDENKARLESAEEEIAILQTAEARLAEIA